MLAVAATAHALRGELPGALLVYAARIDPAAGSRG